MLKTGNKPKKNRNKPENERRREAWNSGKSERSIAAMPLIVAHRATIARYSVHKHGEDFFFSFSRAVGDEEDKTEREEWKEQYLDPYEVRAGFEKVRSPTEALDFLSWTGMFLPGMDGDYLTWSDFQKWQRLVFLVREHKKLAAAAQSGETTGEEVEALKAIGGMYDSAFFSNVPSRYQLDRCEALCTWFRNPPGDAMSITLVPRTEDEDLVRELGRGGAMIEFLLPKDRLRKVWVIRANTTIQAIAATVYADWITGVDYEMCPVCSNLFKIRTRSWKKYCSEKCKGTAHQQRFRATQKKAKPGKQTRAKHGTGKQGRS